MIKSQSTKTAEQERALSLSRELNNIDEDIEYHLRHLESLRCRRVDVCNEMNKLHFQKFDGE